LFSIALLDLSRATSKSKLEKTLFSVKGKRSVQTESEETVHVVVDTVVITVTITFSANEAWTIVLDNWHRKVSG